MMMPIAGKISLLLLALASGYAVLVASQSQQRPLDVLGRFVGGLILVVSFIGLLCTAICAMSCLWGRCYAGGTAYPYSAGMRSNCAMPSSGGPAGPGSKTE